MIKVKYQTIKTVHNQSQTGYTKTIPVSLNINNITKDDVTLPPTCVSKLWSSHCCSTHDIRREVVVVVPIVKYGTCLQGIDARKSRKWWRPFHFFRNQEISREDKFDIDQFVSVRCLFQTLSDKGVIALHWTRLKQINYFVHSRWWTL